MRRSLSQEKIPRGGFSVLDRRVFLTSAAAMAVFRPAGAQTTTPPLEATEADGPNATKFFGRPKENKLSLTCFKNTVC